MFFWIPGICETWRRRSSWLFQLCPSPRPRPRCQRCCWEEETFLIFFLKKDICPWLPDWKIRRPLPPEEVKEWKTSQHSASSSPISSFFSTCQTLSSHCAVSITQLQSYFLKKATFQRITLIHRLIGGLKLQQTGEKIWNGHKQIVCKREDENIRSYFF